MELKNYIHEAISSGKNKSRKNPITPKYQDLVDWAESIGFNRVDSLNKITDRMIDKDPVMWAGMSNYYRAQNIVLFFNHDGNKYSFDFVYRNGANNEPSATFVQKNGYSVRMGGVDGNIDFISKCLL